MSSSAFLLSSSAFILSSSSALSAFLLIASANFRSATTYLSFLAYNLAFLCLIFVALSLALSLAFCYFCKRFLLKFID